MAIVDVKRTAQERFKPAPTRSPCVLERVAFSLACAVGLYVAISSAIHDDSPATTSVVVSQAQPSEAFHLELQPK